VAVVGALCLLVAPGAGAATASTTSVVCAPSPVRPGAPTTCKAIVTGPVHPTGSVSFAGNSSGAFTPGTCTLSPLGGNQAGCTVTYVPGTAATGPQQVYANYSGDEGVAPSHGSTTVDVETGAAPPPGTAISCAPSSLGVFQPTVCTATVTGATPHPTGTVSFESGDARDTFTPPTCTLVQLGGDQARCSVTYRVASRSSATRRVTGAYSGDATHAPTTGSTFVEHHVLSDTKVTCSPTSVAVGSPTTCTATVLGLDGSGTPTGQVVFNRNSSGSFSAGACPLVAGPGASASCSVTYTPAAVETGAHAIYANYPGDFQHTPSNWSTSIAVTP
jgi:hypothetical protein